MATLIPWPKARFFDANGDPLAGGKLYTYKAGTSTPLATYTDQYGVTPNANPVVLDANGEANVWINGSYKMVLKNSADVVQWTIDNVSDVASRLSSHTSGNGSDLISFVDPIAPAYLKTVSDILNGCEVSLFRFINNGLHSAIKAQTDSTDLTANINEAIAASKSIYVPPGKYNTTGSINVSQFGRRIRGDSPLTTIISLASATLDAVNITGAGYYLSGLKFDRSITASAGAGIKVSNDLYGDLVEVWSFNSYRGFQLGPTARSTLFGCRAENNFDHGFYFLTTSSNVAMQWQLRECLAEFNNGSGYHLYAASGASGIDTTSPEVYNCGSYANNGNGFMFTGDSGTAWNDLIMSGSYSSFDGNSGVNFQNCGRNNQIRQYFGEFAGQSATGRGLATAASGVGGGFSIAGTCRGSGTSSLSFSGICQSNSYHGLSVYANDLAKLTIANSLFQDNGKNTGAGNRNGVSIVDLTSTATVVITSTVSGNTSSSNQLYGVAADSVATAGRVFISGCDLTGNATAPTNQTAGAFNITTTKGVTPLLEYKTGAGGTVTQATSKSTSVALNAYSGQITLNNAALASGASVTWWHNNSNVSINDTVVCNIAANSVGSILSYTVAAFPQTGGNILWSLKNVSGGSLSEAVVINYAIIKGATS